MTWFLEMQEEAALRPAPPPRRPVELRQVNTCSLDGPAALPNYRARGLTVYEERTVEKMVPAQPPGPWPDARG